MPNENSTPLRPIASADVSWTKESEALRRRHLSRAVMGDAYRVGVVIEELPPGSQSSPLHYHLFAEQHVYVLDGAPTLRLGDVSYELKRDDYVCFPAGQGVGHCLVNNSDAPCRYVLIGEHDPKDIVIYPQSNKVLVCALGPDAVFDLAAWRGEGADHPRAQVADLITRYRLARGAAGAWLLRPQQASDL